MTDELKVVIEEEIKERVVNIQSDIKVLTKQFAAKEGEDMWSLRDKEVILKQISLHKKRIEELHFLLYDISKLTTDLEINQLIDSLIRNEARARNHIEKAAKVSTLLYEDYLDYSTCNMVISELKYIQITVRKKMEGEY
ncbi:hypothetical protein TROLL_31 [Bacillus phage Troll]|uniref:Uncharacterized protein n=5 Tax=Caudoviricetes TaxID=2731619 RepID=A0A075LYH3_9CAUD|nr:hypothetical protein TROLL_31 [Bacillus phage Troll]YP_009055792.1 hypothetical protein LD11_gp027 [Bacillus phage Riley]AMW61514.1 hypothetical protein JUGLONE_27 [Bacillus phage Juglone]ASZ75761.1 hypothetical protein TAFFO16_28 [Bacillus phage Taffo16]ULF48649.1 hypothetical protein [Bacillus phage BillyBob]AGT13557.1 hypothetical protein TROLL_31 [Bacillus phage Troll]AIF71903.1 hypothetical protein [Bacillus phage Riley]